MPVGWVNKVGSSPTFLAIFQNRIVEFRGNPAPGEPSTRGNPAPGFVLDLILMVSFGFFHTCQAWFASWNDVSLETMNPTGSRKPYAPKKQGNFFGDEELREVGEVMWWKASKTKKEKSNGQKKDISCRRPPLGVQRLHLPPFRLGWVKKNGRLEGTCGLVRLLLVKTG